MRSRIGKVRFQTQRTTISPFSVESAFARNKSENQSWSYVGYCGFIYVSFLFKGTPNIQPSSRSGEQLSSIFGSQPYFGKDVRSLRRSFMRTRDQVISIKYNLGYVRLMFYLMLYLFAGTCHLLSRSKNLKNQLLTFQIFYREKLQDLIVDLR